MTAHPRTSSGYWYAAEGDRPPAVQVLEALRAYRAAESAMRLRTRDSMGMGEKDVLALRYLLEADRAGTPMSPRDLASKLGISSASTTTLLDRRALVIVATQEADCEVRSTLGAMHERMLRAARDLSAEEAATVTAFLHAMAEAVEAVDERQLHEHVEDCRHPGPGAA